MSGNLDIFRVNISSVLKPQKNIRRKLKFLFSIATKPQGNKPHAVLKIGTNRNYVHLIYKNVCFVVHNSDLDMYGNSISMYKIYYIFRNFLCNNDDICYQIIKC